MPADYSRWTERWQRLWGDRPVEDPIPPDSLRGLGAGAQEVLLLLHGERTSTRLMIPAGKVASALHAVDALGLVALPSPFLLRPFRLDSEWSYSDRVEPVPEGVWDSDASAFLYLARDTQTALHAWASEVLQDNGEFGRILGYPDCCIANFGCSTTINGTHHGDFTQHAPWQTNRFARYFGYELISHQPCCLDCEKTLELADRYMHCLQGVSRQTCTKLRKVLESPVIVVGESSFLLLREAVRESNDLLTAPTSGVLSFGEEAHGFRRRLTKLGSVFSVIWCGEEVAIKFGSEEWQLQDAYLILHGEEWRKHG
jgi:hypothetical protein